MPYKDPKTTHIEDWKWAPLERVQKQIDLTEVPDYILKGYGEFMQQQAKRAAAGQLTPREVLKAYGITMSSIGRTGLSHATATKSGLKLPNTGDKIRPEGAFAEWLLSPMGQRYLNAAEKGKADKEALRDIQTKFNPYGKYNQLAAQLHSAARTIPGMTPEINRTVPMGRKDYRPVAEAMSGVGPAKSGFVGSMLGMGDLPTLDARQLELHAPGPGPTKSKTGILDRGKKMAGREAVDRLAARQIAMQLKLDPEFAKFYQHLAHHAVWDKTEGTQTTHADIVNAMKNAKNGGGIGMAEGGEKLPAHPGLGREGNIPRLPVAKPKTKSEIRAIAERMAPQIIGQDFVRPPGKTDGPSVADKTQKQFNREKSLQHDIRPIGNQPTYSDVDLADYKDKVMIGLAGDATPTNRVIHGVGGTDLVRPSTQEGGPLYGLHNPGKSWASNRGAASGVLSLAEAAARQYGVEGSDVLANYIKMSPEGSNFAQHFADALLATIDPSKLTKKDIMYMNAVIKSGNKKNPKGFLSAPSVADSDAMYNAMLQDPELRKHFANRMMMAAVYKGRNIIPGPDVLHAATEPELRDLENGVTGFSVGKIPSKNAKLTPSTHSTYSDDIPGDFLGRLAVPLPYEMAFPDAVQAIKNSPRHANTLFGTLKSSGARQQITPQLINEIGEYRRHIKRLTGKAEGGMVGLNDVVGKKPQPSMDEMRAALTLRKGGNKVDMSSIGAYEAPDLPVKMYAPPGPGQLPVGGVDMSDTPGQQFVPNDQQAQPGQQQPGQQPPQGPGAAPQAPQGAPQGADSNILQMTPQGQAMAAMTPSQNSQPPDQPDDQNPLQGMAEGGSPKPVYTHEVYDIKTKKVKGQYQSANAARRGVDYYDNQYGGYRHDYRQINKPPSEGMARGGSVNLALPRVQKKAGGGRMTTAQMSAELLNKMGVKHPAIKELTTLDDYHKTIGDQVQEQVGKMRNIQSGFNYKYDKGQHVFTKDSAAKNHPPYTIVARTLWGNHPMREPHPVNPLMGKPIKDPATGKVRRTPHEPGYRIKYSTKDGNEVETDIPEWAILGSVKMSQGGLAKGKR